MDTVANMLTSLVNAQRADKKRVAVPYSAFNHRLLQMLQEKGFIASVRVQESPRSKLVVTLLYDDRTPKISGVKRLSSPGRRWYAAHNEIPYSYQGFGMIVLSTSQGLVDQDRARREKIGGELVCAIW
ncbi:MAG: 30S ribosomal protein S8 [Candidatus Andersenbacteria bacterium]